MLHLLRPMLCLAKIPTGFQIKNVAWGQLDLSMCQTRRMLCLLRLLIELFIRCFRSRCDVLLENLALRQQLGVLKKRYPQPRFAPSDRLFWVILRRIWIGWKQALILVQPETVVRWHRAGFKAYWTWLSRHRTATARSIPL